MDAAPSTVDGLRIFEWRNLVVEAFTRLSRMPEADHAPHFAVDRLAARAAELWPLVHTTVKVPGTDLLEQRVQQFLESDPSSFAATEYGAGEGKRVLWSMRSHSMPSPILHGAQHFAPVSPSSVPAESQAADSLLALAFAERYYGGSLPSPAPSLIVSPNGGAGDRRITPPTGVPALCSLLAGCPPGTDDDGVSAWLASLVPVLALEAVADPHERACPEAVLPDPSGHGKLALLLAHPSYSSIIANALHAVRLRAYTEVDIKPKGEILEQYSWQGCLGSEITVRKVDTPAPDFRSHRAFDRDTSGQSPLPNDATTSSRGDLTDEATLFCLFRVESVLQSAGQAYAPAAPLSLHHGYFPVTPEAKSTPQKKCAPPNLSAGRTNSGEKGGKSPADVVVKVCTNCATATTSAWRRCPDDGSLLCNRCGLYYKTYKRHRPNKDSEPPVKVKRTRVADSRRCGRCGTGETPVWRRGPQHEMLCNACGLQAKDYDGRRPANRSSNAPEARKSALPKPPRFGKGAARTTGPAEPAEAWKADPAASNTVARGCQLPFPVGAFEPAEKGEVHVRPDLATEAIIRGDVTDGLEPGGADSARPRRAPQSTASEIVAAAEMDAAASRYPLKGAEADTEREASEEVSTPSTGAGTGAAALAPGAERSNHPRPDWPVQAGYRAGKSEPKIWPAGEDFKIRVCPVAERPERRPCTGPDEIPVTAKICLSLPSEGFTAAAGGGTSGPEGHVRSWVAGVAAVLGPTPSALPGEDGDVLSF